MGGSILGRPIELLSDGHQQKPDVGAAIAWFYSDLAAIFDSPNTFPWAVDNYALGHRTGAAVLEDGRRDQFF
jgi:hypothetical protein